MAMLFWPLLIAGGVAINFAFMERAPLLAVLAGILYAAAIQVYGK